MSAGADIDLLVERLKWEAETTMPPKKAREFARFLGGMQPPQRVLPFGAAK